MGAETQRIPGRVLALRVSPAAAWELLLRRLESRLNPRLAWFAGLLVLATSTSALAWLLFTSHGFIDAFHQPVGGDFVIFYGASDLTLHGRPLLAFDSDALLAAERAVVPHLGRGWEWCYPPTYQLLIAPLALAPFPVAYAGFILTTFLLYLGVMRGAAPARSWLLIACSFPAVFVNVIGGQNGFLTAALLGFGLLSIDRRPWLAGMALGLLAYKPQFGILLPVLLAATGRWRSFGGAAASASVFIVASFACFGFEQWAAFLHKLPDVSVSLMQGRLPWTKMPSTIVMLMSFGIPAKVAIIVQGVAAIGLAWVTVAAWRRPGDHRLKAGLAMTAVILMTPYAFDYDLVLLAVPFALVIAYAQDHALAVGTKTSLVLIALAPNLLGGLAKTTHLQLMPAALMLFYAALLRLLAQQSQGAEISGIAASAPWNAPRAMVKP